MSLKKYAPVLVILIVSVVDNQYHSERAVMVTLSGQGRVSPCPLRVTKQNYEMDDWPDKCREDHNEQEIF